MVDETKLEVSYRHSIEKFVGLGIISAIPDATTLAFFRKRLRKARVIEELFERFEAYPRAPSVFKPVAADH